MFTSQLYMHSYAKRSAVARSKQMKVLHEAYRYRTGHPLLIQAESTFPPVSLASSWKAFQSIGPCIGSFSSRAFKLSGEVTGKLRQRAHHSPDGSSQ